MCALMLILPLTLLHFCIEKVFFIHKEKNKTKHQNTKLFQFAPSPSSRLTSLLSLVKEHKYFVTKLTHFFLEQSRRVG